VLLGAAACAAVVLAVLGPLHVIYPNQPWYPSSAYSGYGAAWTFYVGTKTETDGLPTPADHAAAEDRLHEDAYYWREGLENMVAEPLDSTLLWLSKQWRLWGASHGALPTTSAPFDRAVEKAGMFINGVVLASAVAGLALLAFARERRLALVLAMPALYAALVFTTLSGVEARYGFAPALLLVIPGALLIARLRALVDRSASVAPGRRPVA
jgi:hypothetical protein